MAFFECEFPRSIQFHRIGGQIFNTDIRSVGSGHEKRTGNWIEARAEYEASLISPQSAIGNLDQFIEDVRTFFLLVGGMADPFRFFDHVDNQATNEPLAIVSGSVWQLQKTYTLAGRTYVRSISKPITSSVIDFQGNALGNTVFVANATVSSIDHTTGQVILSSITGTPTASFKYHIPVRLASDKFEPEVEPSTSGNRLMSWHSLGLMEVLSPNY